MEEKIEKYRETSRIRTVEEVKEFFHYLATERRMDFHPDDTFVGREGLEAEEQKRFDRLLEECFTVCDEYCVDIYELALKEVSSPNTK